MSKLRRYYAPGQVYFITLVTAQRRPILIDCPDLFFDAWRQTRSIVPFRLQAYVLLPDHFHAIIDPGTSDFADLVRRFKLIYTCRSPRHSAGEGGEVWQARFWDHILRNDADGQHHLDYIHYNPVKHGLVSRTTDWKWSSFAYHVARGQYTEDWGDFTPNEDYLYGE